MVRLPDIPEDLWKNDLLQQFERLTSTQFPALEFDMATRDLEAEQLNPLLDVEEEQARLEELQAQQRESELAEQERQRQESNQIYQQYLNQLEQKKYEDDQLVSQAQQVGITTPDQFTEEINKFSHRPGLNDPDNTSSAVYGLGTQEFPSTAPEGGDQIMDPMSFESTLRRTFEEGVKGVSDFVTDPVGTVRRNWIQEGPTTDFYGTPTEAQPTTHRFEDTGFARTGREYLESIKPIAPAEQEAREARRRAGLDPYEGELETSGVIPGLGIATPIREAIQSALGAPQRELLPEEERAEKARREAAAIAQETPAKIIGNIVDTFLADPEGKVKRKDEYGVMDALGISEGMTIGEVVANVSPNKILQIPQWFQVGAQMVRDPLPTSVGLAALGSLGKLAQYPWGRRLALGFLGGLGGGIDAYVQDKGLAEGATEVAAGMLAGGAAIPGFKGAARLIKDVASSPTTADIYRYLDVLAGKVYDDALASARPYPAIAEGLGIDAAAVDPLIDRVKNITRQFDILDRIERMTDGGYDKFKALHQFLTDRGDAASARLKSSSDIPVVLEEERKALTRSIIQEDTPEGWGAAEPGLTRQERVAEAFEGRVRENIPNLLIAPGLVGTAAGTGAGAAAGLATVPEDAPFEQKFEAAGRGALAGAGIGTVTGVNAGIIGTYGLTKLFQKALISGRMADDIFSSHPDAAYRVASAMLLSARNKADDEIVRLPDRVRVFIQRGVGVDIPPDDLTAGQIRDLYGNYNLNKLGRVTRDLISDMLMGDESGAMRLREMGADEAAVEGLIRPRPDLNRTPDVSQRATSSEFSRIVGGPRSQVTPEQHPEVWNRVNTITDNLGLPRARIFLSPDTAINASAYTRTGRAPVITINQGALDKLDDDALGAVLLHEYSHATDDDISRGLLQRSAAFLYRMSGSRVGDSSARPIVPEEVVDQMTGIPVGRIEDPAIIRAIEARGGRYDPETGVTAGVTRAQGTRAAGGIAARGGPFYEPIRPGERSSYYEEGQEAVAGALGGEVELPRTVTRYRNPLIMRQTPDGMSAYDNALAQLNVTDTDGRVIRRAGIDTQLQDIRSQTRRGSPERIEALKSLITRYGGDPNLVDTMQQVAGDTEESSYAVVENIIATNARRQGYDAAFLFERDVIDVVALYDDPQYFSLRDEEERLRGLIAGRWGDPEIRGLQMQHTAASQALNELSNKYRTPKWSEIMAIREDRNPVPAPMREGIDERGIPGEYPVGRPGYSVHPEIALPEGTVRRTFEEPTVTPPPDIEPKLAPYRQRLESATARMETLRDQIDAWVDANPDKARDHERTLQLYPDYADLYKQYEDAWSERTWALSSMDAIRRDAPKGPQITPPEWRSFPGSQNLAAGTAAGAAAEALSPEEQEDPSWQGILAAGILGGLAWKSRKGVRLPPELESSPVRAMLKSSGDQPRHTDLGFFERIHDGIVEKFTDSYGKLQQYQEDISKEFKRQFGTLIPAHTLAAELKRLDYIRSAEMYIDENIKPALLAFARNKKIDEATVDEYLLHTQYLDVARHAADYDNTGLIDTNRKFPGGVTAEYSEKWLQDFDAMMRRDWTPQERQEFADATQRIWKAGEYNLKLLRDSGLIDDATHDNLRKIYPRYVPMNILAYQSDAAAVALGRSLSVRGNTIHKLTEEGTTKPAMGPLASVVGSVYETYAAANKNRVFNAFVSMWQEASRLQSGLPARGSRSQQRVGELADLVQLWDSSKSVKSAGEQPGWTPLEGYINGIKIKFAVHSDLGDVTKFDSPVSVPVLSGLMNLFRATTTARNPVFLTSNAALDFATYMARESARNRMNFGQVAAEWATAMFTELIDPRVWGDIARHEYRGGSREFLAGGGGFSGHAPRSNFIPSTVVDPRSPDWIERKLAEAFSALGYENLSDTQREVQRLRRRSDLPIGAATTAGAIGGAYTGVATAPEEATARERFERGAVGALAGAVAGATPVGMVEGRNALDIARIVRDVLTLKPVEAIGERLELVPRVAAMRLAEKRYTKPVQRLLQQRAQAITSGDELTASRLQGQIDDMIAREDIEKIISGRTTTIDFNKGGAWAKTINQFLPFFNVGVQAIADIPRMYRENPAGASTVMAAMLVPIIGAEIVNNWDQQTREDYDDVPDFLKHQGVVLMHPGEAPVDEQGNRHPQFTHIRYRQFAPIAIAGRALLQATVFRHPEEADGRDIWNKLWGGLETGLQMAEAISPVQSTGVEDLAVSVVPPYLGTAQQIAFNRDTFRNRNIVSGAADERASPLAQSLAKRLGFSEASKHPSWWEFVTRDTLTGQAGMWHGASEILGGEKQARSPQEQPFTGGLYSRWVKGSIGQKATEAREQVLTPSGRKILEDNNLTWRPSPVQPEIKQAPLTRREYAEYQTLINKATDVAIHEAEKHELWQGADRVLKQKVLDVHLDEYRKQARVAYGTKLGIDELRRRVDNEIKKGKLLDPDILRKE